ncbi:tRNA pseudouridine(38-40) synthase TruA [Paenibacillus beijingensis]|uniref:tRNA pseudouridine synthase A n=1 Tax=Paenibacillus beijingensis TaxID=1126833 RepID=A0A0D5NR15_9BACL|nr:tRNA pseudouridine(38-40) synthase TruA [Paenibacillus beijingensis]AJY77696.1 tRNA pseudouridine synthase A [Paenibacillus beijingensis]
MTLSYDGTNYNGFQTQPAGNTVQDLIEAAIEQLTGERLKITGSGRTDAGVHARGFVFNFYTNSQIPVKRWALALNSRLPHDIVVLDAAEVDDDFHSRRCAKRKTYRYSIDRSKFRDVFVRHTHFHHPMPLDVPAMRQALKHLLGTHDYTSFTSTRSTKQSHVRTIFEAHLVEEGPMLHLYITGSGFLYNMVRIITGTLMWVGEGKMQPDDFARILQARNRSCAGPTAMAHGLTLWQVEY